MANYTGSLSKMDPVSLNQEVKCRSLPKREIILGVLALIVTIGLSVSAIYFKSDFDKITGLAGYSLLGVLIISFLAGSTLSMLAIPVPYWILVFTLPSVLDARWGLLAPVLVAAVSALGATIGHIPTFMIGYGSRSISEKVTTKFNNKYYTCAIDWAKKHGSWAVFLMSAVLNPFHLPMTIAIGALRFPPPKFFFFSYLGNLVKNLVIAYCGYFGLTSLFRLFGL